MGVPDWVICVVIATSASIVSNFGLNLQKLALTYRSRGIPYAVYGIIWFLGFLGIVSGALCDFAGAYDPLGSLLRRTAVVLEDLRCPATDAGS